MTDDQNVLIIEWLDDQSIASFGKVKKGELSELPRKDAELFVLRGLAQIPESVICTYKGPRDSFIHKYKSKKYLFKKGYPRVVPIAVVRELKAYPRNFSLQSTGQVVVLSNAGKRILDHRYRKRQVTKQDLEELIKNRYYLIKYNGNMGDILRATCLAEALYYAGHKVSLVVKPEMKPLLENNPLIFDRDHKMYSIEDEIDLNQIRVHGNEGRNKLRTVTWLESFGLKDSTFRRPLYFPTKEEIEWAGTVIDRSQFTIALGTHASVQGKTWNKWEELKERLNDAYVVLDEQPYKWTVRQAAALISISDLVITNDSLHLHLAGAMDVKCIGLFGNTNGEVMCQDYAFCYPIQGMCVENKEPCWYKIDCGKNYFQDDLPCLQSITVDEVLNKIKKVRIV